MAPVPPGSQPGRGVEEGDPGGDDRPIGVFDSGFGGLSVVRGLMDLVPREDLVYIGDTGRYPYGPRDLDEVRRFAEQLTAKLVGDHDVKMVVVACNTAAAAALDGLRAEHDIPLVGVVEPGLRAALRATRRGRVGVIGTVGTIASGAYQRAAAAAPTGLELTCAACPGLVEFVERGETSSDQLSVLVERLLAPVRAAAVDTLLLGCTHYPFLARTISDVIGRDVVLVSPAEETAFEVRRILEGSGTGRRGTGVGRPRWISSGDETRFAELGRRLLGPEIDVVEHWEPPAP